MEPYPIDNKVRSSTSNVARSASQYFGAEMGLVGWAREGMVCGEWTELTLPWGKIPYFPVIDEDAFLKSYWQKMRFALKVAWFRKKIAVNNKWPIVTHLHEIIWIEMMLGEKWPCIYIAPGLFNQYAYGRKKILGKVFAPLFSIMQKIFLPKTAAVFAAASRSTIASYEKTLKNVKIHQLPTTVDLEIYKPLSKEECRKILGIKKDQNLVLTFVGRFAKQKNIPFLLNVLEKLGDQDPILLLAGDGEERALIDEIINRKKLKDKIMRLGVIPSEKVAVAFGAADVITVTSREEGFSVAMLEAIACGRPIVTTPVSGADEMIVNGINGFISDHDDVDSFAAHVIMAKRLEDSAGISKMAAEKYNGDIIWGQFRKNLKGLI
jgi:glycosyltransferase involved in cell wall biosynthesis